MASTENKKLAFVLTAKNTDLKAKFEASKKIADNVSKSMVKNNQDLGVSYNELKKTQAVLLKGLKTLDEGSEEYKKTQQRLINVSNALNQKNKQFNSSLRTTTKELKKTEKASKDYLSTLAELANIASGAKVVFDGLADAYNKIAGSALSAAEETAFYVDSAKDIPKIAADVDAISKAYDQNTKEILLAAKAISREYNLSLQQGLEIVEKGFQAGGKQAGDFAGAIAEFAPQFKDAGIEAENMLSILISMGKQGFLSEKTADVIKEATISIREMTKSTKDALKAADFDPDQITQDLKNGTKTISDVIQEISRKMATMKSDSVEVGMLLADVFRGVGEDAGTGFYAALGNASKDLDRMVQSADFATKQNDKLAQSWKNLNTEIFKLIGIGDISKEFEALGVQFIADNLDKVISLVDAVINGFITAYNYVSDFFVDMKIFFDNAEIRAKAFGEVIANLFTAFKLAFKELTSGNFDNASKIVDTFFGMNQTMLKEAGEKVGKNITKGVKEKLENDVQAVSIKDLLSHLKTEVVEVPVRIKLVGQGTKQQGVGMAGLIPAPMLGETQRVGEAFSQGAEQGNDSLNKMNESMEKLYQTTGLTESSMLSLFNIISQGAKQGEFDFASLAKVIAYAGLLAASGGNPLIATLGSEIVGVGVGALTSERRATGGPLAKSADQAIRVNDGGIEETLVKPSNQMMFNDSAKSPVEINLSGKVSNKDIFFSYTQGQQQQQQRNIANKTTTMI